VPIKPLCLGRKEGELIKDLAGSCSLYYKCVDKKAMNATCAAGTTLDVKAQACVDAYNVAGCAPSKAISECAPPAARSHTRTQIWQSSARRKQRTAFTPTRLRACAASCVWAMRSSTTRAQPPAVRSSPPSTVSVSPTLRSAISPNLVLQ
jgi:hypothetical protein